MKPKAKITVYTYVCGDILHIGHLVYLENAKSLGGILVVGVLTDEAIMEEKEAPLMSFDERIRLVSALQCVNVAIPQNTYSPISNIKLLEPDIVVESESHSKRLLTAVKNCAKSVGSKVIVLPYYPGKSSSQIKEKYGKS